MHYLDQGVRFAEMLSQSVGEIHRAMLTACTADGDSEVAAIIVLMFGDPARQKADDIGEH